MAPTGLTGILSVMASNSSCAVVSSDSAAESPAAAFSAGLFAEASLGDLLPFFPVSFFACASRRHPSRYAPKPFHHTIKQ
jgi:hypothetical protein